MSQHLLLGIRVPLNMEAPLSWSVSSSNPLSQVRVHLTLVCPASNAHLHLNCFALQLFFLTTAAFLVNIFINSKSDRKQKLSPKITYAETATKSFLLGSITKCNLFPNHHSFTPNVVQRGNNKRRAESLIPAYWWSLYTEVEVTRLISVQMWDQNRTCQKKNLEYIIFLKNSD